VAAAHRAGFPVAVHTIDLAPLRAVLRVLGRDPPPAGRDRLEHVSVCPPAEQAQIAKLRLGVISQPNFVFANGDRYLAEVPAEERRWLYPTGALLRRGVVVAAGSDAPVAVPDPRPGLYGAVTRRTRAGAELGAPHAIDRRQALVLQTRTPALLGGWGADLGRLAPGYLADLIVWEDDPLTVPPEELLRIRPYLVILNGLPLRSGANGT